jgi:hypothetical protein
MRRVARECVCVCVLRCMARESVALRVLGLPLDVTLMMCWGVGDRGGCAHGARCGAQKAHALLFLPPPARGCLSSSFDREQRRERRQRGNTPNTRPRNPSTRPRTPITHSRRTRPPRRAGGKAGEETKASARRLVEDYSEWVNRPLPN